MAIFFWEMPIVGAFFLKQLIAGGLHQLDLGKYGIHPMKCWYNWYMFLIMCFLWLFYFQWYIAIYTSYGYYIYFLWLLYAYNDIWPYKKSCSRTPVDGGWRRLQGTWNVVCCQSSPGHCRVALHLWVHRCSLLEWNWKTSTNTTKELQDTICLEHVRPRSRVGSSNLRVLNNHPMKKYGK